MRGLAADVACVGKLVNMELTVSVLVAFLSYVVGTVLKFTKFNSQYQPLVNLGIGVVTTILAIITGLMPSQTLQDIVIAVVSCCMAAMSAGGIYDLTKTKAPEQIK